MLPVMTKSIQELRDLSKYMAIVSLLVLIPFFTFENWDSRRRHEVPLNLSFDEAELRVFGAAKSPATIVITKDGRKVFSSSCDGLRKSICDHEEYWKKTHYAKSIDAIEISPQKGIIRKLTLIGSHKEIIEINNEEADSFIAAQDKQSYKGSLGLFVIFCLSGLFFIVSNILIKKNFSGD